MDLLFWGRFFYFIMGEVAKIKTGEIVNIQDAKNLAKKITTIKQAIQAASKIGLETDEIIPVASDVLWEEKALGQFLEKMDKNKGASKKGWKNAIQSKDSVVPTVIEIVGSLNKSSLLQKVAKINDDDIQKYIDLCIEDKSIPKDNELLIVIKMGGLKLSESIEWYTPAKYIEAARQAMGAIDLDPASTQMANNIVKAKRYITKDDDPDGLSQPWSGNIWLNPPYGKGSGLFTTKLLEEFSSGRVKSAILLLNAYGFDSFWFQPLWNYTICFTDHRIEFYSPQKESGGPANANIFIYMGKNPELFRKIFKQFGHIIRLWDE